MNRALGLLFAWLLGMLCLLSARLMWFAPEQEQVISILSLADGKDDGYDINPSPAASCKPPLHTSGRHILNADGDIFKLVSVNWYGASDKYFVPGGLDIQHRSLIAATIRRLGFNSVRIVYADQMVRDNPFIPPDLVASNPDLFGQRALAIYGAVVKSLTEAGLAVIVNNHITQARWCCDANPCDAAWSNDYLPRSWCPVRQTEDQWIENWEEVMAPHIDDPLVIGADLRNEVRGIWGTMRWATWAQASERLSERLLAMQPNWLMIVEGISSANDIRGARTRSIRLSVPGRLVYSAHVYGWSGWGSLRPYWYRNYKSFAKDMHKNWGYLLEEEIAPVWIGEFGAPDQPKKRDLHYWNNLMRYLKKSDAGFAYWAINPRKPDQKEQESYSLVADDWQKLKYDYRMRDINSMMQNETGIE